MEEIDPEAAKIYREKEELKVVEERLRVRHGATSKFAKNLKRFQNLDDKDTRDAYHKVIQERNALLHKTKQTTANERNESSDESDSDLSEDLAKTKEKTIKKIKKEIDSSEESESDNSNAEEYFDFKKTEQKATNKQETGIMGLKFMQKAE